MNTKKLRLVALSLMALPTAGYTDLQDQTPSLTISGEASGTYYGFRSSQREGD